MNIIDLASARDTRCASRSCADHCTDRPSSPAKVVASGEEDAGRAGRLATEPARLSPGRQTVAETLRLEEMRAPRYTSYPTADRFVEAFGPEDHARHLSARAFGPPAPLSLYVHVPFCESLCHYCGCNRTVTRSRGKSAHWLERLLDKADLVDAVLGGDRCVSQLHLGGGTPTFLDADELTRLTTGLGEHFEFRADAERSIAAQFDRHLRARRDRGAFSRVL